MNRQVDLRSFILFKLDRKMTCNLISEDKYLSVSGCSRKLYMRASLVNTKEALMYSFLLYRLPWGCRPPFWYLAVKQNAINLSRYLISARFKSFSMESHNFLVLCRGNLGCWDTDWSRCIVSKYSFITCQVASYPIKQGMYQ